MDILFFLEYLPTLIDLVFKIVVILACVKYLKAK